MKFATSVLLRQSRKLKALKPEERKYVADQVRGFRKARPYPTALHALRRAYGNLTVKGIRKKHRESH